MSHHLVGRVSMLSLFVMIIQVTQAERRLVIHIGPEKTGTTNMQNRLSALQRKGTLEHMGWCWPSHFTSWKHVLNNGYGKQHCLIAGALDHTHSKPTKEFRDSVLGGLRKFIDEPHREELDVILTSECFASLEGDDLSQFRHLFPDFTIRVVMNIRSFPSLWLSNYHQHVREAANYRWKRDDMMLFPFSSYLFRSMASPLSDYFHRRIDSPAIIHRYSEAFGAENLTLVDMDGVLMAKQETFVVFMRDVLDATAKLDLQAEARLQSTAHVRQAHAEVSPAGELRTLFWRWAATVTSSPDELFTTGFARKVACLCPSPRSLKIPYVCRNLMASPFFTSTNQVDASIRASTVNGTKILFPSKPDHQLPSRLPSCEIDAFALTSDPGWSAWMYKEYDRLKAIPGQTKECPKADCDRAEEHMPLNQLPDKW